MNIHLKTSLYITLGEFINLQYNGMISFFEIFVFKEKKQRINQLKSQIGCFHLTACYLVYSDSLSFFNRFL